MKLLANTPEGINKKDLLEAARARGIWSMRELAKRVPCAPTSLYGCIERPSRFSRVRARLKELTAI